jgi:hypothetical protein
MCNKKALDNAFRLFSPVLSNIEVYPPKAESGIKHRESSIEHLPVHSFIPKAVVKKPAQKPLKTRLFLAKRCKNPLIFDKKMQKSTKKCSFLPSFFA